MLNACTALFRGAGYRRSAGECRRRPSTPRWPSTTPTSPPRSAAWWTATPGRSASPCAPTGRCRTGCCGRLDALPEEMAAAERRAKRYERAVIDLVEAFLLKDRVGEVFPGTVVDVDRERDRGTVMIPEPAVSAKVQGSHLPLGEAVSGAAGQRRRDEGRRELRARLRSAAACGGSRAGLSPIGCLTAPRLDRRHQAGCSRVQRSLLRSRARPWRRRARSRSRSGTGWCRSRLSTRQTVRLTSSSFSSRMLSDWCSATEAVILAVELDDQAGLPGRTGREFRGSSAPRRTRAG